MPPLNGNQYTTQKHNYKKEIVPELNDTEELPEGTVPINFKLIEKYQWTEPSLLAKYKELFTKKVLFMEEVIKILTL